MPKDLDDGDSFPIRSALVTAGTSIVLIVLAAGALNLNEANMPPVARYYGCYAALGGPRIEVLKTTFVVLQSEPIKLSNKLDNSKGWKFKIDRWLEVRRQGGQFSIVTTGTSGQLLPLSYGEQAGGQVPQFTLYDRAGKSAVTYSRTTERCS